MLQVKKSVVAFLCLMALMVAVSAFIPGTGQGQNVQPPQNVTVINSTKEPVPVRDMDNGRQPFQLTGTIFVPKGDSGRVTSIFKVPEGKRLVIETISARTELAQIDTPDDFNVITKTGFSPAFNQILVLRQGLDLNGRNVYVGTHYMRAYADPGTEIDFQLTRSNTGNDASGTVTIVGYFIDLP